MQIEKLAKLFEGLGWDVERKRAGCAPGRERERNGTEKRGQQNLKMLV